MVRCCCIRVSLDYVSLGSIRRCQSVTVSAGALLSFASSVIRLILRPLRWTRWYAAAAYGSRLTTSRLVCFRRCQSVMVSAGAQPSFDSSVTRLRLRLLRWTR